MANKQYESSFVEMLSTLVLKQLAIGVIISDVDGQVRWANDRQEWISGMSAGLLNGESIYDLPTFAQVGLARVVRQVLQESKPHYHFITHKGIFCRTEVLPLQVGGRTMGAAVLFYDRDSEGAQKLQRLQADTGINTSAADLANELKYFEFELAEQRALLLLLTQTLDILPFPVAIIDPSQQILFANIPFKKMVNVSTKVLGSHLSRLVPEAERATIEKCIGESLQKGRSVHTAQTLQKNIKDQINSQFVFTKLDPRTGIEAVVMILLNGPLVGSVPERDAFADKFESLCQFTGRIVHNIRNPLTALLCELDFLRNEDLYEKGGIHKFQKGIDLIEQQVHDINTILQQVEHFGAEDTDELAEANISDILLNARVVAELQRPYKGVHIEADIPEGLPLLACNAIRLQKAIVEILLNALDAAGENGIVSLSLHHIKTENIFQVRVRDNGPGISEDLRHKIFDPFFSTKKKHGAGLGLTIAYAAVTQHGGTIDVHAAAKKGTEVTIRLPLNNPNIN